jgi:hypothetical protein
MNPPKSIWLVSFYDAGMEHPDVDRAYWTEAEAQKACEEGMARYNGTLDSGSCRRSRATRGDHFGYSYDEIALEGPQPTGLQFQDADEQRAWDLYAASSFTNWWADYAALRADELLVLRRLRSGLCKPAVEKLNGDLVAAVEEVGNALRGIEQSFDQFAAEVGDNESPALRVVAYTISDD